MLLRWFQINIKIILILLQFVASELTIIIKGEFISRKFSKLSIVHSEVDVSPIKSGELIDFGIMPHLMQYCAPNLPELQTLDEDEQLLNDYGKVFRRIEIKKAKVLSITPKPDCDITHIFFNDIEEFPVFKNNISTSWKNLCRNSLHVNIVLVVILKDFKVTKYVHDWGDSRVASMNVPTVCLVPDKPRTGKNKRVIISRSLISIFIEYESSVTGDVLQMVKLSPGHFVQSSFGVDALYTAANKKNKMRSQEYINIELFHSARYEEIYEYDDYIEKY